MRLESNNGKCCLWTTCRSSPLPLYFSQLLIYFKNLKIPNLNNNNPDSPIVTGSFSFGQLPAVFFFELTAGYYIIPYLKLRTCVLELPALLSLASVSDPAVW